MPTGSFAFRFAAAYRLAGLPLGITPATAHIDLEYGDLTARFGPWVLSTSLRNVESAVVTGPYGYLKTIGPPHLSFSDRGLTFATNRSEGLCISFKEAVPAIEPFGILRHPALTVTVTEPGELRDALLAA